MRKFTKFPKSTIKAAQRIKYPSFAEALDWLSVHEQAYADFCEYYDFDVDPEDFDFIMEEISYDDLKDWIYDHEQLRSDFEAYFNVVL